MSRFLMIDIGAGTMDILYYNTESDLHYKAVVKSPVPHLAELAAKLEGDLFVTGCEMGGGPITSFLREHAVGSEVVMTASAAATLHHDLDIVRSWGIKIVEGDGAQGIPTGGKYTPLVLGDLQPDRLRQIVEGFGVPFEFDAVAVCGQDHGVAPPGISHLDFRHNLFTSRLDKEPFAHTLLYRNDEVPPSLNRLRSMAALARKLPTDEIYVMDSGMAAILGASMDTLAAGKQKILVMDVATSHTVGGALIGDEIAGFFEYHTVDITSQRMQILLQNLANGDIDHKQILAEGGHGAYLRRSIGFDSVETIIATGPRRRLIKDMRLAFGYGAPLGDNMMTGTVGLLEALRRRKGLPEITYI